MKLNMMVVMTMCAAALGLQIGRDQRPQRADQRRGDDRQREDQPPRQHAVEGEATTATPSPAM